MENVQNTEKVVNFPVGGKVTGTTVTGDVTSKVTYLRLLTGEEVVAKASQKTVGLRQVWVLNDPLRILITQDGKLGFQPLALFGLSKTKEVKDEHVMWTDTPDNQIGQAYLQTVSGLLLPQGGLASARPQEPKLNLVAA